MTIAQEEIFGPVLSIIPYSSEEEQQKLLCFALQESPSEKLHGLIMKQLRESQGRHSDGK